MKKVVILLLASLFIIELTGCRTLSNQDVGVMSGGVIGGLIGSRFGHGGGRVAATVGGAMIGALVGGRIGEYMDRTDRLEIYQSLENDRPASWHNERTTYDYTVTRTRTYDYDDYTCREYTTTAIIGGRQQQVYGRACRTAGGSWRIQNS